MELPIVKGIPDKKKENSLKLFVPTITIDKLCLIVTGHRMSYHM